MEKRSFSDLHINEGLLRGLCVVLLRVIIVIRPIVRREAQLLDREVPAVGIALLPVPAPRNQCDINIPRHKKKTGAIVEG